MKTEQEIQVSLQMHREALSFSKDQFLNRLTELVESGELNADIKDEELVSKLYDQMQYIERAVVREIEWILEKHQDQSDEWVGNILDNL